MKLRSRLAIAAVTITGLTAGIASAASADDTDATFTLTGGTLSLAVETDATLTDAATGVAAITIDLGAVSVTDERGGLAEWTVSATSTAFTGGLGSSSTAVSYNAGTVVETGTITVADGTDVALDAVEDEAVVTSFDVSGNNTASWTAALTVSMPASALADTYNGTVTTPIV